jgi:hypothetical protein
MIRFPLSRCLSLSLKRLLGRIISPNPPSIVTVRDFLIQAWKFASPFTVDIIPGVHFLFTVSSKDLVVKIMDNG